MRGPSKFWKLKRSPCHIEFKLSDHAAAFPEGTPKALKALLAPNDVTPLPSPLKRAGRESDEGGEGAASETSPRDEDDALRLPEPALAANGKKSATLLLASPSKPRGSAVLAPIGVASA